MANDADNSPAAGRGGSCRDCGEAPTENLAHMFIRLVQTGWIKQGQWPAQRPVFLKPHGVAYGRFEPVGDLPDDLKVGVFALGPLAAWSGCPAIPCPFWATATPRTQRKDS
jgi:hypothetical protein